MAHDVLCMGMHGDNIQRIPWLGIHSYIIQWHVFLWLGIHNYNTQWNMIFFGCECAATPYNGNWCLLGFAFTGPAYSGTCSSAWTSTAITDKGTWWFYLQITAIPHDGLRGLVTSWSGTGFFAWAFTNTTYNGAWFSLVGNAQLEHTVNSALVGSSYL